jgi:hypothetical protein
LHDRQEEESGCHLGPPQPRSWTDFSVFTREYLATLNDLPFDAQVGEIKNYDAQMRKTYDLAVISY